MRKTPNSLPQALASKPITHGTAAAAAVQLIEAAMPLLSTLQWLPAFSCSCCLVCAMCCCVVLGPSAAALLHSGVTDSSSSQP